MAQRWDIEVFHRTLKSGCRIEDLQLAQADRLETCLAIDLVIAWCIQRLTKLAREVPQAPCSVHFDKPQWRALMIFTNRDAVAPEEPPPTLHGPCTASPSSAAFSDANAMASRVLKPCGAVYNASMTSPRCTSR